MSFLLQVTSILTSGVVFVRPATVTQWEQLDKCVLQTQGNVCALTRPLLAAGVTSARISILDLTPSWAG